jgi:hypothetical protein
MEILRDNGQMASWEVAEKVDRGSKFVWEYLSRLRSYGAVDKEEHLWFMTDFGLYLTDLLCSNNNNNNKINTRSTQQQHKINTSPPKRPVQVSIQAWLRDSSPPDAERGVVDLLVSHFNKTGSKFVLVKDHYAMSELLSINVNEVPDILAGLRQENIIYLMRDPTSGMWKLGLKKAFLELLGRDELK